MRDAGCGMRDAGCGMKAKGTHSQPLPGRRCNGVFAFFSSSLGCIGSIVVSVAVTLLIVVLMHGCGGAPTGP